MSFLYKMSPCGSAACAAEPRGFFIYFLRLFTASSLGNVISSHCGHSHMHGDTLFPPVIIAHPFLLRLNVCGKPIRVSENDYEEEEEEEEESPAVPQRKKTPSICW